MILFHIISLYLVPKSGEHERCSSVFVNLIDPKHHDEVFDNSWLFSHSHGHV